MTDTKNKKDDPTEAPDFKKVVKHFLETPPKPHKKKGDDKRRRPPASDQNLENGGDD